MQFQLGTVTIELTTMVPTADGRGKTRQRIGYRDANVVAYIDVSKLIYLARRAAGSRGRKATALHGAVVCKVVHSIDRMV